MQNDMTNKKPLIFKTGKDVRITARAEYFSSIIADGKELITGKVKGCLHVAELKNPEVYVTFKKGKKKFDDVFFACKSLKEIPADLFANCTKATSFNCAFIACSSLKKVPANLFAGCPEAMGFEWVFGNCKALEGQSPYTMVNGEKVKLWERSEKNGLARVKRFGDAFLNCKGLSDYNRIPTYWK